MKNIKVVYKIGPVILALLLFNSCYNDKSDDIGHFKLFFPSEVTSGDIEFGKIEFHSPLDTLLLDEEDRRYTYLYLGVFDENKQMSLDELKKQKLDTFVMLEENIIPFDIHFSKVGKLKLDGYISDQVILDKYDSSGNARIITNEVRIIKEIQVDSPVSKANK